MNNWLTLLFSALMQESLNGTGVYSKHIIPCDIDDLLYKNLIDYICWQLDCNSHDIRIEKGASAYSHCLPTSHGMALGVSGGIDSTIAVYYGTMMYRKKPLLINVQYGSPYYEAEAYAIQNILGSTVHIECVTNLGLNQTATGPVECVTNYTLDSNIFPDGYIIPLRNSLIASVISDYANNIWLGVNYRALNSSNIANSGVRDKGIDFFCRISELLSLLHNEPIIVTSPFLHLSKKDIILWYIENKEDGVDILAKTVSCYHPIKNNDVWIGCGRCYTCWKKAKAVKELDIIDAFKWDKHPFTDPCVSNYEDKEKNKGR